MADDFSGQLAPGKSPAPAIPGGLACRLRCLQGAGLILALPASLFAERRSGSWLAG